jgi:hypothetical protein
MKYIVKITVIYYSEEVGEKSYVLDSIDQFKEDYNRLLKAFESWKSKLRIEKKNLALIGSFITCLRRSIPPIDGFTEDELKLVRDFWNKYFLTINDREYIYNISSVEYAEVSDNFKFIKI